jgi:DNA-binding CsgD family transcriptional regulator
MKRDYNTLVHPGSNLLKFPGYSKEKEPLHVRISLSPENPDNNYLHFFSQCLVDPNGKQFACLHDHCHDLYSCFRQEVLHEYLAYHALRFYPSDRRLWCQRVYPDIVNFLKPVSADDLPNFRISFNHRYVNKNEAVSQFFHEGTLRIDNNQNEPVLNLKVFSEIGDIKSDDSIILSIYKYSDEYGYEKVFHKIYSDQQDSILTLRELEIIRLCHEGLSSKMIADKLKLSIHTVKNHKRNIMEKTMTHNISELIHLCIQNRWL